MAMTRKVMLKPGYGDIFQDGERYGPGQVFGVDDDTYAAIKDRVTVVAKSAEAQDPPDEALVVPEALEGVTAADLRAMTRDEIRQLAHDAGIKVSANLGKDRMVDALVARLPEEAR